ncbi:hypothetical protein GCM10009540_76300 [Streptomyces turgidiscabies]
MAGLGIQANPARVVCASQCVGLRFAVGGGFALQGCELAFYLMWPLSSGCSDWRGGRVVAERANRLSANREIGGSQ